MIQSPRQYDKFSDLINHSRASLVKIGTFCIGFGSLVSATSVFLSNTRTPAIYRQSIGLYVAGIVGIAFIFFLNSRTNQEDKSMRNLFVLALLVYVPNMNGYAMFPSHDHERTLIVLGILFGAATMSTQVYLLTYAAMLAGWHFVSEFNGRILETADLFYMWFFVPVFGVVSGLCLRGHLQRVFRLEQETKRRADELTKAHAKLSEEQALREEAERKRLAIEDTIKQQHDQLLHVSRANTMGEMVAGIAHEINQPLNAISMHCGVLSHPNASEQSRSAALLQISDLTDRCGKIIRRLQGFIRRNSGSESAVNLAEVIGDSIALAANAARQHNIQVTFENNCHDAPNSGPVVMVDAIEIQQVIVNLQQNAFEAMENNAIDERNVTIRLDMDEGVAQVSVADQGGGIANEDLGKVFEPFFTSKNDGLGMGLAICRSIAERYNGTISVRPNEESGSTFTLSLPRNAQSDVACSLSR